MPMPNPPCRTELESPHSQSPAISGEPFDVEELEELPVPRGVGCPMTSGWRYAFVGWSLFLVCGFGAAARLRPDARGYGTHQQLGLPECSLRTWLGIPCPSCGGTTAFSLFVRGRWMAAVQANAAAFGLALVSVVMIPWCLWSAVIGRTWRVDCPDNLVLWIIGVFGVVSLLQWLLMLALGVGA
jgi:hypothetical protein